MKENYIVFKDENDVWLITNDIANRIKIGEDFDFNARLDDNLSDDSTYLRLNSLDGRIKLKLIKEEK